jgi:hypothetical protein
MMRPSMFADCTGRATKACKPNVELPGIYINGSIDERARIGETTCCTESQKQFQSVVSVLQDLTDEI